MQKNLSDISIGVIGLGYVGLPVLTHFGKKFNVFGFDINESRISELKSGYDNTCEVESSDLKNSNITFSSNIDDLKSVNFFIVAVPTPIDDYKRPDLMALKKASESVGRVLKPNDIVVYESTVYPGVTEDFCAPILEKASGLKRNEFRLGYSPERINPADKEHTFSKITKVVSGEDFETRDIIAKVYSFVVEAGVYLASSIKVAEAAKVIENTQRDLNIALMNELAIIFNKMNIDTNEVIDTASTKWNFLPFRPGLVGGHCIGVDPYYLTYAAEKAGHIPQVILAGRRTNDSMGEFIVGKTIKLLAKGKHDLSKVKVTILGITFKEDCPDTRNSRVIDIINELREYNVDIQVSDPLANADEVYRDYKIKLTPLEELQKSEAIIIAVPHKIFFSHGNHLLEQISKENTLLIDVKGISNKVPISKNITTTWKL